MRGGGIQQTKGKTMTEQTATAPLFAIEGGVPIPPRTIPNAGPRDSKYPVDQLQEGQAFAVPVKDEKEARQKQSQMSGLAKSRHIKLVTRFYRDGEQSPFANTPAPCLGVWHGGKADPKARKPKANAATDANAAATPTATATVQSEASDTTAAQPAVLEL